MELLTGAGTLDDADNLGHGETLTPEAAADDGACRTDGVAIGAHCPVPVETTSTSR